MEETLKIIFKNISLVPSFVNFPFSCNYTKEMQNLTI